MNDHDHDDNAFATDFPSLPADFPLADLQATAMLRMYDDFSVLIFIIISIII